MKLTFFGHSAFQIETAGATILVDPFITDNPLATNVISEGDLSPDAILLTHAHGDHFGDTPAIAERSGAVVVANYEITQYLTKHHGHENVQPMNTGGAWSFDWGRVTQTWARHSSSFPDGTYGGNPGGFIIESEGKCIYAAGDTSPFEEMKWIGQDFSIDLALLPIGDCFTMGLRESVRAASLLNAARFMPIHYNTFPLIEVDTDEWKDMMAESGHEIVVLSPGESIEV
jgi:L-ascorbate metabolism protein UlaG (beta-lactamase superfamily)